MAVSLSNNFSLYNHSKPLCFTNTNSPFHLNPSRISFPSNYYSSPLLLLSFSNTKTPFSFNSSLSVKATNSASQINDQDEVYVDNLENSEIVEEKIPTLKSLLKVYKEAVLIGDESTASIVESRICQVENEKNELVTKNSALASEMNSGKERYIRLQADFDNFRKRSEKEKLTIRSDAEGEVIRSMLPMVDSFERAKQQLKLQTEQEKKIDASYQGIYKQFVEIMRSLRVAVVATVGKPFDPLLHEAIAREQSHEFKEGIIVQEFRRGFLLGDKLLRPATVKVSAGPGKKNASTVINTLFQRFDFEGKRKKVEERGQKILNSLFQSFIEGRKGKEEEGKYVLKLSSQIWKEEERKQITSISLAFSSSHLPSLSFPFFS